MFDFSARKTVTPPTQSISFIMPLNRFSRCQRVFRFALAAFLTCALAAHLVAQNRGRTQGSGVGGGFGSAGTRQYLPNTMLGDAVVEIDPETRSLIIITDDKTNDAIKQVVTTLDRPKPQVLIKVVFLEVTHRKGLDLGAEGSVTYTKNGTTGTTESLFGLATQTSGGFARLMDDDFQVTLRAIADTGKLEVLARPSIIARNNQEAVITIGKEVPFIRNTRVLDTGQTLNTVEYEDIGIILRVTPFITSDGQVEMIVAPEISTTTDETVPISDTIDAPVFAKRSAETVVVTPNGQTVVIGGLMQDQKTESVRKVPLLGDIPLLGLLFQRRITENEKTELLIFLTPQIVERPSDLAALSDVEQGSLRIAPESFTNEELEKYVDPTKMTRPDRNPPSRSKIQ